MMSKKLVYTIKASLLFDPVEDINITTYLEPLQEIGVAEVIDVKLIDSDDEDDDDDDD
jgi:hypothetical protein